MSRVLRFTMVVGTALLLAACGGDGNGGGGGGGNGGGTAALSTVDNAFQPASLTVTAGSDLEVTNDGQALHNLTIEGTDVAQDVESGATETVAIDAEAGDYTMFCEYHRAIGMEGVITIQ